MSEMRDFLPGKSYPVIKDRKPRLWWFLTSRKTNTWDYDDEGNLTDILATDKETWRQAFLWHFWMPSKIHMKLRRWTERKLPCGCSENKFTHKHRAWMTPCTAHGLGKMAKEMGIEL